MARNWTRRLTIGLLLALAAPLFGYSVAVLLGALIPANPGWRQGDSGVRIFVADNGVHTDLILPVAAEGIDWRELVRTENLADPRRAASHLTFGWGDRDFYLNTPDWSAMTPGRAAGALFGSGASVLHIAHIGTPAEGPRVRALLLSPEQYRRLAAAVRASFALDAAGRSQGQRGFGAGDAFYAAHGGYSALSTCNEWTGRALRAAGVRVGVWTPLPASVMLWL